MTNVRTAEQFQAWVAEARPGDRLLYHTGYLPRDRQGVKQRSLLSAVADEAAQQQRAGNVDLVQKRPEAGVQRFEYWAVRKAPPAPEPKRRSHRPGAWFEGNKNPPRRSGI